MTWGDDMADRTGADAIIRPLDQPGDLGWVIMEHGAVYAAEFGWDTTFEALVARIVADYAADHDPSREAAWIAAVDGRRVGCVFCVDAGQPGGTTPHRRTLRVPPGGGGSRLGGGLVARCMSFARAAGHRPLRLWTTAVRAAARHTYLQRGFTLIQEE